MAINLSNLVRYETGERKRSKLKKIRLSDPEKGHKDCKRFRKTRASKDI